MPWQLTAQLIESCSCNNPCPCAFGVPELAVPDQGYCADAFLFRIHQGSSDGVDLAARTVVVRVDWPGSPFDGAGVARLYMDKQATAQQESELAAIFRGESGGPWALIGGFVTSWLPTQRAEIVIDEQGDLATISVGGVGEVTSRLLRDPRGEPMSMQTGMSCALEMNAFQPAVTAGRWSDPALRQFEIKTGVRATFSWSG